MSLDLREDGKNIVPFPSVEQEDVGRAVSLLYVSLDVWEIGGSTIPSVEIVSVVEDSLLYTAAIIITLSSGGESLISVLDLSLENDEDIIILFRFIYSTPPSPHLPCHPS